MFTWSYGRGGEPLDAVVFKVRQEGKVINKAVQIAVGLNNQGRKEVLGMWTCQNESASLLDERVDKPKRPGY